jgi:ATP-dependent helicase/DNAse subunit B
MSATLFLVTGPVGSGKTKALVDRYRTWAGGGIGRCLWLVPTERCREVLRRQLVVPGRALLAPNLLTFPDFARQLVRAGEPSSQPLPEFHQRILLEDILAALVDRGHLPYFAAVAKSRGFAESVFSLLTELKGQGVTPTLFDRTIEQIGGAINAEKASQLARIFQYYQKRLTDRHLLDRETTYERARDLWSAGRTGPFANVRAVFVDGFVDFTPPQVGLLAAVVGSVEELWTTVMTDAVGDDTRAELFNRSLGTAAKLNQLSVGRRTEVRTDAEMFSRRPRPAGLKHLETALFRPERPGPSSASDGIQFIEAPGLVGEVRLVARAIKTLLLDGASADDIVITARDLGTYADLVREVFAEYGLPADLEGTEPLIRNPAVAALLRAVRLADDGFPFAATTALLRNIYFRPAWPEVEADADVASRAELLLRLLGEPHGREAYLRAARVWAADIPPGLEDENAEGSRRRRKHELAKRCLPFLERYFLAWNRIPAKARLSAHAEWLRAFATDLGLATVAEQTDAAAWTRFWAEIEAWAREEEHLHAQPPTYAPPAFQRLLAVLAGSIGMPRSPGGPGRVRVLSADQARHLGCDHLFIVGLGERSFPDLSGGGQLLDEGERQAFRSAGLDVRCAADRLPDEMLLFYQLVTRPRRQLVLSYPAVDEKGQALLPSSFLTAVDECFAEDAVPVLRRQMLIEGYDRQRPLSPAEFRIRWAAGSSRLQPADEAQRSDLFDHLRTAERIGRERFKSREYSPYDGLLRAPSVVADLRDRFGPDAVISPTALESYVACPFRFYLEQVLRLEPLEDPAEEVEHTCRGAAVHRALSRLHNRLKAAATHSPAEDLAERMIVELRTAVEEHAARVSSPAAKALWQLECQRLERAAARYGGHWAKFQGPWTKAAIALRPHAFEVNFGLGGEAGPLIVRHEDIEVRIGGRVDRVDLTELDDGSVGFWVIDYKTGRSGYHTATDVQSLLKLQLPLYALAVERLIVEGGRPLGLAYWLVADGGPKPALPGRAVTAWLKATDHWQRFRDQLERWVATLARHIRGGEFPLRPRAPDCTDTCRFGQVCRIAESRSVEKNWNLPLPTVAEAGADADE